MEVDKFASAIEKYVREFILYLLSFFRSAESEVTQKNLDPVNKTGVFAILSAVGGAYLWNWYIYSSLSDIYNLSKIVADSLLKWLCFGLILHILLVLCKVRSHILRPVLAVFKVFSVAYILSIFGAYAAKNVIWIFSNSSYYKLNGSDFSATAAYILQAIIITFYMPKEISAIMEVVGKLSSKVIVNLVFLIAVNVNSAANFWDPVAGCEAHLKFNGPKKLPSGCVGKEGSARND